MKVTILLMLTLLLTDSNMSIEVRPNVVSEGGTVTVMCHVPRSKQNKWLAVGLEDYTESGHDLTAPDASLTYLDEFKNIPCPTVFQSIGRAYCSLETTTGTRAVFANLKVAGCREGEPAPEVSHEKFR